MTHSVSPQSAQQLLKAIEKACVEAKNLKQLLVAEKECLQQRQFIAHQSLVKQKNQCLMSLEATDQERQQRLQGMGFNSDKEGFMLFLQQVPANWKDRFTGCWEELSDLMNACARLNKVNGKILAHSQSSMERLMAVIKGASQQMSTYQANGRRAANQHHRMLVTA